MCISQLSGLLPQVRHRLHNPGNPVTWYGEWVNKWITQMWGGYEH